MSTDREHETTGDQATSYATAATRTVTADGKVFAYRALGPASKVPVLFCNHLAATLDNGDPRIIDAIARERRVITFDQPGVGASTGTVKGTVAAMADDARVFVRALGLEQVDIVGFSLGGMVGQALALAHPRLVRRLVLAGTGPAGGRGIDAVARVTYRAMVRAAVARVDPKQYLFFNRDEDGKQAARDFINRLRERAAHPDTPITTTALRTQLKAIKAWGRAEPADLSRLVQPTLVVNGDRDKMVPSSLSQDLHRRLPDSRLVIYPNSGHGAIFQCHDQFARDVLAHLVTQADGDPGGPRQHAHLARRTTMSTDAPHLPSSYRSTPTTLIDVEGVPVAYRELGIPGGVPVVFLNHLTGVLDDWDPRVVDAIAEEHHVITFDNRGVGSSGGATPANAEQMARDAVAFVRALGHDTVDLVGFSLGGGLAQIIALEQPQLVRRAVLAGTGPRGGYRIEKVPGLVFKTLAKAMILRKDPKNGLFFTRTENGKRSAKQFLARLQERTEDRDEPISLSSLVAQLRAIRRWGRQTPDDLGKLNTPVLISNGIDDVMVPTTNSLDMARRIPGAQLQLFPDSGHGGIFQYHDEFSRRVLEFLN